MDDSIISSLVGRKAAKKPKSRKKKPIKVVYISNPMRVKTSASEFRATVQKLTGQDAELPDQTKFTDTEDDGVDGGGNQRVPDDGKNSTDYHAKEVPREGEKPTVHHHEQQYSTGPHDQDVPFDTFDEVFTPQMLENFTGFLPPGLFL